MMADSSKPSSDIEPQSASDDASLQAARETLEELLAKMRVPAQVAAAWQPIVDAGDPRTLMLEVTGDDLGSLIGPRGETVAALQYITRLIVSKEVGEGINILIDVEGHRRRREEQLRRMARRMAEQAVERGRTMVLEPMPPAERRIVHLELRDHPDIHTESVGDGDKRKVTIIPNKPMP
jgi:spoIIIJ-associated protein